MNGHRRLSTRGWWLPLAALLGGPALLYYLLPIAGVPAAVASGLAAIVVLKHLGVLAVVLTPLYALLRRRRKP